MKQIKEKPTQPGNEIDGFHSSIASHKRKEGRPLSTAVGHMRTGATSTSRSACFPRVLRRDTQQNGLIKGERH